MRLARQRVSAKRRRPARAWPRFRRLAFEPLEARRLLAVLTVSSTGDVFDLQDGAVTLREAILAANTDTQTELGDQASGADEIRFAPSLFSGGPVTISLLNGELVVTRALTISGPGANLLTIDAQQQSRIINFTAFTDDCTLAGLTLTGGRTTGDNGASGGDSSFSGGAVRSQSMSNLTLDQCIVTGNRTDGTNAGGGGVFTTGSISVIGSTITGNQTMGVSAPGGGLYAREDIDLVNSTLSGNSTADELAAGGGAFTFLAVNISGSTISGNFTTGNESPGGGFRAAGDVTIENSTISGNFTQGANSDGGGFDHGVINNPRPSLEVRNSTIAGNSAQGPGSVGGGFVSYSDTISLANSIVANNSANASNPELLVDSTTLSIRYSLIRIVSGLTPSQLAIINAGPGNIINQDPLLFPLSDNGGPTQTHALQAVSPAFNAGDPGFQPPPAFDQRGDSFARIALGRVDMGAFEVQFSGPQTFVVDTLADEDDGDFSPGDLSLREAIRQANQNVGEADTITFASNLNGATILLTMGELPITDSVTIDANSLAAGVTIDASGNDPTPAVNNGDGTRVLHIDDGNAAVRQQVTLLGLTFTGGDVSGRGGAIYSLEDLSASKCTISGNAANNGGGISSVSGTLNVRDSTLSGNSSVSGGGIHFSDGTLTVVNSTLSGNTADHNGGGMTLYLNSSNSTASIRHSTITGNISDFNLDLDSSGGGVYASGAGQLEIEHTIIAGNFDNSGVAPDLDLTTDPPASVRLLYSLIGNNRGSGFSGAPVGAPNEDGNLIGDPNGGGVISPRLDPLANYGGPTSTHRLQSDSPAVNAGAPNAVAGEAGVPLEDQRGAGFSRIVGPRIDMGAFESDVVNRDPVVTPAGPQTSSEGGLYFSPILTTFTDADASDTHTATIDWGDGSPVDAGAVDQLLHRVGGSHTYADNGAYTVTVTVLDDQGGSDSATLTMTVSNIDPTLNGTAGLTVDEGQSFTLTELSVGLSDPGFDTETFANLTIDWGDGTPAVPYTIINVVNGASLSPTTAQFSHAPHAYADDGTYTVTIMVQDDDGPAVARQFQIAVGNVLPTLTLSGPADVNEGSIYTLNLASFDPGADTIASWTIDWGVGLPELFSGNPASVTHVYADGEASFVISATAADEDGTYAAGNTVSVAVHDVAPTLTLSGPADVNEGSAYTLTLSSADPGTDTIASWTINWGDSVQVVTGNPASVTHVYADGEASFVISATAADEDGTYAAGNTVSVMVHNVVPTLSVVSNQSVDSGETLSLVDLAAITDPGFAGLLAPSGTSETFRVYLDWGDGTIVTGTATIDDVGGILALTRASFDGDHVYDTEDTFQVTVRIADDDMSGNFATGTSGIDFVESSFVVLVGAIVLPFELPLVQPPDQPPVEVVPEPVVPVGNLPSLLLTIPPALPTRFPESDGGAGGGVPTPLLFEVPPGARAILDERVIQAAYYQPSVVRREEVVDAVFTLGDIELVSLVGVDMGDDPVLGRQRKSAPAETDVPVAEPPALPLIADVPVPEVPAGPSWNSLAFWAALAGSGTLWLGGTWWWMRRGRKIGQR